MGVYIKGMEMPTSCIKCKLCVSYKCVLTGEIRWSDEFDYDSNRFEDCPLFPVAPHGRLIDADELVERIEGIWDCNDMTFRPDDHICDVPSDCKGCKWAQTVDCIKRMVENARTIIPAEEEK